MSMNQTTISLFGQLKNNYGILEASMKEKDERIAQLSSTNARLSENEKQNQLTIDTLQTIISAKQRRSNVEACVYQAENGAEQAD